MQQLDYNQEPVGGGELSLLREDALRLLDRMVRSSEFQNSERMSRFLKYVFDRTLAGDDGALKESTIGVFVFDREPGYSPKADPVVRSEARRLREKIQRYFDGEGREEPLRVELPKGGYVAVFRRLAPPIAAGVCEPVVAADEVLPPPEPPLAPAPAVPPQAAKAPSRIALVITLIIGLLAGALLARRLPPSTPASSYIGAEKTWNYPLTSLPGQELDPAISPDATTVAFIWDHNGGDFDLYTVPLSGGEPRQITATPERDLHPAWSPDGRRLAFLRTSPRGIEVWTTGADGRDSAKLSELRWYEWLNWRSDPLTTNANPGPAWTADGSSLILSDVAGSQQGAALWELELRTKARRQISRPAELAHDFYPAVSPDNRSVAFVRQFSASNCDLFVLDRATGEERRLTNEARDIHGLSWLPDGKTLLFSSTRGGPFQLWTINIESRKPVPVPAAGDRIGHPVVSRDGRHVVYSTATINVNLWGKRVGGSGQAYPLVQSTGQNLHPRFSPDGHSLAWSSDRTGNWEIWTSRADGTSQRQLTHLGSGWHGRLLGTPRWSPDSKWIAFDARLTGNSAIFVISADGGEPRAIDGNSWEERNPSFSRDGQWIYFNSNRSGLVQIWRRRVDGSGQAERVTTRRGYDAVESARDGGVYFLPALAEAGIWRVDRDRGAEQMLLPTLSFLIRRQWDMVNENLYFVGNDAKARTLFRMNAAGEANAEALMELDGAVMPDTNAIAVSPDERTVVYAKPEAMRSDLMAIETRVR